MAEFTQCEQDVISLASDIIHEFHPELRGCSIGFAMRVCEVNKKGTVALPKSGGKVVLGTCRKVPANLLPYLSEEIEFLITLTDDPWYQMDGNQRKALLDHELSHIELVEKEDGEEYRLRGHDIEEFNHVIRRWGMWRPDLLATDSAFKDARQLTFIPPEAKQGKVVALAGFEAPE